MQLISLYLENYRQHKSSEIHFPAGLVGILGANGSGKSTILEAIAWAIYGNERSVVKGGKDTLIWRLAPPRSAAVAELSFAFAGRTFTIRRTQTSDRTLAELQQDGRTIANSVEAVKSAVLGILNMTHQEFFNSYFTGQKDLKFLGGITSGADRERFIAKMLGYERIEQAQGDSNKRGTIRYVRNELKTQVARIQGAMEAFDPEAIASNSTRVRQALQQQQSALTQLDEQIVQQTIKLNELAQNLQQLENKQEQFTQIQHQIELKTTELQQVQQRIREIQQESTRLARELERYHALKQETADYLSLCQQEKNWQSQYQRWCEQERIKSRIGELEAEILELSLKQSVIQKTVASQSDLIQAWEASKGQCQQLEAELQAMQMAWQNDCALAKAELQTQRQLLKKLEKQIADITQAGEDGRCPTCDRPLQDEYELVMANLHRQLNQIQATIEQGQTQLQQLEKEPPELEQLRHNKSQLEQRIRQLESQKTELELQNRTLQMYNQQIENKQKQLQAQQQLVVAVDYDPVSHQAIQEQIKSLQSQYQEMLRLEHTPVQYQTIQEQLQSKQAEKLALEQAIADLQETQIALQFNPSQYTELKQLHQQLQQAQQQLLAERQHTQHQIDLLQRDLALYQQQEQEYQAKKLELVKAQREYLLYQTLDESFTALRQHLTQQIRPQLSETASLLLTELTDGRYSALELDENYNVAVIESGDRKSVISGGEEDIVNLCLRLAVSQMISERTGQPFSLLILDEVFGSLDEQRRDNVLQLLHRLGNQFSQVLVISHIDIIKESLNHTICLEYLPREQYSRVVVQ